MIGNAMQTETSIQPGELRRRLAAGRSARLLDVRTPGEYAAAHVPGAQLIPLDKLTPPPFAASGAVMARRSMCSASQAGARAAPSKGWSARARGAVSWLRAERKRGLTPGCP